MGIGFTPALRSPSRWQDWAVRYSDKPDHPRTQEGKPFGWKWRPLFAAGDGKLFDFINKDLLPHLHSLDVDPRTNLPIPGATPKQRIIGRLRRGFVRIAAEITGALNDRAGSGTKGDAEFAGDDVGAPPRHTGLDKSIVQPHHKPD